MTMIYSEKDINMDVNKQTGTSLCSFTGSNYDTPILGSVTSKRRTTGPTRRSKRGGWTEEDDNLLTDSVKRFKGKSWKKIAEFIPGRSDVQCLHRWQKVLNPDLVKGPWSKEEDNCIAELVEKFGCRRWSVIAKHLPGRIGKQCRERWHNHLDPAIKKDAWTEEEESVLYYYHKKFGNKWAEMTRFLPGRTDNAIKNHWNCSAKRRFESTETSSFESNSCSTDLVLGSCNKRSKTNPSHPTPDRTSISHCSTDLVLGQAPKSIDSKNADLKLWNKDYYTSPRRMDSMTPSGSKLSFNGGCESILRNAAISFAETPSIIRKRIYAKGDENEEYCCFRMPQTSNVLDSVRRNLSHAFDMESHLSKA